MDSSFFVNLGPPSNTDLIRYLIRSVKKGSVNGIFHHILGGMKAEVHLQNFSQVSTSYHDRSPIIKRLARSRVRYYNER